MSYGKWLAAAIAPSEGSEWKAVQHKDPTSNTPIALKYVDGANNIHPFQRNGWFMLSNFAKQQRLEENSDIAAPDSLKKILLQKAGKNSLCTAINLLFQRYSRLTLRYSQRIYSKIVFGYIPLTGVYVISPF